MVLLYKNVCNSHGLVIRTILQDILMLKGYPFFRSKLPGDCQKALQDFFSRHCVFSGTVENSLSAC